MNNEILIIIPAYNPPIKLFESLLTKLEGAFKHVLIVNDGSDESFNDFFKKLEKKYHVLKHEYNLGKGEAIKTAYRFAYDNYKDVLAYVVIDCDNQHDIEDMINCCKAAIEHPDSLVIGVRDFSLDTVPFKSKAGNKITRLMFKWLFNKDITDTQTGLRAISPTIVNKLLAVSGSRYNYELKCLITCCEENIPIVEVPIKTIYIENNKESRFNPVKDSFIIYKEFINYYLRLFIPYLISLLVFLIVFYFMNSNNDLKALIIVNIIAGIINIVTNIIMNYRNIYKHNNLGNNLVYILKKILKIFIAGFFIYICYNLLNINLLLSKVLVDIILTIIIFLIFRNVGFKNEKKN